MNAMMSQFTSLTIVYSTFYSVANQRNHQSSAWLAFLKGIQRWPVNSPHKGPVTWKMFPFDDVIMEWQNRAAQCQSMKTMVKHGHIKNHFISWQSAPCPQISGCGMCKHWSNMVSTNKGLLHDAVHISPKHFKLIFQRVATKHVLNLSWKLSMFHGVYINQLDMAF